MNIKHRGIRRAWSTFRHAWGARILTWAFAITITGCGSDSAVAPPTGAFPWRAVRVDRGIIVGVPASVATYPGDTTRYVSGGFELGPGSQWRERWERVLVSGVVESQPRVFETQGIYRITEMSAGTVVMDLYPGQIIPAHLSPTAVLRGDTLSHGPFIFVR